MPTCSPGAHPGACCFSPPPPGTRIWTHRGRSCAQTQESASGSLNWQRLPSRFFISIDNASRSFPPLRSVGSSLTSWAEAESKLVLILGIFLIFVSLPLAFCLLAFPSGRVRPTMQRPLPNAYYRIPYTCQNATSAPTPTPSLRPPISPPQLFPVPGPPVTSVAPRTQDRDLPQGSSGFWGPKGSV